MTVSTGWRRLGTTVGLTAAIGLLGCSTKTSDRDIVFVDPDQGLELVGARKRLLGLAGESTGTWVDPRTVAEFDAGHIPSALHVPMESVLTRKRELQKYDVLVVYGNSYNSTLAVAMSKMLLENGHKGVRTLRGGLQSWKAAGQPIVTTAQEAKEAEEAKAGTP